MGTFWLVALSFAAGLLVAGIEACWPVIWRTFVRLTEWVLFDGADRRKGGKMDPPE